MYSFSLIYNRVLNVTILATIFGVINSFSFWKGSSDNKNDLTNGYGVDVSFPIHHGVDPNTYMGKLYKDNIQGCYDKFSQHLCEANERARMEMNVDQPATQHNYTELGFKKLKVPKEAWEPLLAFWNDNKDKMAIENWPAGNTYTNNWASPTYMVSMEDGKLRGSGNRLKKTIWDGVQPILEEWVGKKLKETSMYGIRVYKENAILATHVDRLPLVTSCIIQVAQDIDEPWPVEVYSHDGKAYNITMEPGDMALYESHTVLHGRPFPLKGRLYANLFVHFIPIDHDIMNEQDLKEHSKHTHHKTTSNLKISGHEQSNHDEEDVIRHMHNMDRERGDIDHHHFHGGDDLEETQQQQQQHQQGSQEDEENENEEQEQQQEEQEEPYEQDPLRTELHDAVAEGDMDRVIEIVEANKSLIHAKDKLDWQPIHEAARAGHYEVVDFLFTHGADLTSKTKFGGTPLWWARRSLHEGHHVIEFLEDLGAPDEGTEL